MNDERDLEAVRRCLRGEAGAFEEIIVKYQRAVLNVTYRIIRNREDAQDVAQAAFVKAYRSLPSFDSRYKFFSWLYRIAVNESLNFVSRARRRGAPVPAWTSAGPDPQERLVEAELARMLDAAALELKPGQRALLALSVDGLSYDEMGRILELTAKTVKSRLFSARLRLRDHLRRSGWPVHDR